MARRTRQTPPGRRLVRRRCVVCDWDGEQVEAADQGHFPCPLCHAATRIVAQAQIVEPTAGKNPFAAALSRLGARKGGQARARALTPARRREIARRAAEARWQGVRRKRKSRGKRGKNKG